MTLYKIIYILYIIYIYYYIIHVGSYRKTAVEAIFLRIPAIFFVSAKIRILLVPKRQVVDAEVHLAWRGC